MADVSIVVIEIWQNRELSSGVLSFHPETFAFIISSMKNNFIYLQQAPSPINCNCHSFQCYSTSVPFCPRVNLCLEKIKLVSAILEISSLCQGSSVVLWLGTPITRIASRSWVIYLIFWNLLMSVWTFWELTLLSEMLDFLSENFRIP